MSNYIIQYVLWNTCKNNCDFCFDKYSIKNDNRIENLKKIITLLDNDEVRKCDGISLIGGEIFDTKFNDNVSNLFYTLIDKIFLLKKRLFFMTNLIYDKTIELKPCIDYITYSGNIKNTYICTSYDIKGRFHNSNSLKIFDDNCEYIKNVSNLHIEMILSNTLLDFVVNDKFSFEDFFLKYTDSVGFNAPYPGISGQKTTSTFIQNFDFFPKRELFYKFLKKCFIERKVLNPDSFMNRKYYSNTVYFIIDGEYKRITNREIYGNMTQDFHNYIDDDKHTMYEDFLLFKEAYGI